MPSFYRQQLEDYLAQLDVVADTVFDVGGEQRPVEGRTKTWNVREYRVLDLPEIDLDVPFTYPSHADLVFCLEVFEYLVVPSIAMQNLAALLKPEGRIVISLPLVYPLHDETSRDSLRYTITGITRLAEQAGLTVSKTHYRRAKTGSLQQYYAEDGMGRADGHKHDITGYIVELSHAQA